MSAAGIIAAHYVDSFVEPTKSVVRFYLEASGAAPVSPAFDAAWDVTTGADSRPMTTPKLSTTAAFKASGAETSTSAVNVLNRQFVSAPLVAQTITGTFKGMFRCQESNAGADARAQIVVRVVSGDGLTVRGTLWAADTATLASEFPASPTSAGHRKFPLGWVSPGAALSPVFAQDGDRLVVEVGARYHNVVSTSYTHQTAFGSSGATDIPESEAGTTNVNPWVEFSALALA